MNPGQKKEYAERYSQAVEKFTASPEANIEFCRELYWQLRSEFSDCQKKISRWALYAVVFLCIFELLNRNLISNASFSGIQLHRLGFVTYYLPPAVAFCILNLLAIGGEQANYEYLMMNLARRKFPGLHASEINLLFTGGTGLLSNDIPEIFATRIGQFNTSLYALVQFGFILIGYPSFEVYAYVELFGHTRHFNGAAFVSLLATTSITIMVALRLIDISSDPGYRVSTERERSPKQ